MKRLLTPFAILLVSITFAQDPIEKTIGEFTELKVYDLIEVKLIKSNENKVVISGKNTQDLVVINKNGKLKIRMNLEKIFDGKNTSIDLYYTNVDVLDANEGSYIHSEDIINQFEIDLRAQEGGTIKIPLDVKFANINSASGGIIETTGVANKQDISLNTGGIYEGRELQSENSDVTIKAAGVAHVKASDLVDVKIRAGGDVFVYGDPKTIKENRVFGGRVKRVN